MNKNLVPIEREGQRVLLTSQLAEGYETTPDIINRNFNRNRERYQAGKHFFLLEGESLREFKSTTGQFDLSLNRVNKLYLWTEKGAFLHAKSLNTDKAWEVYDELVETYFRIREQAIPIEQLSPELRAFKEIWDGMVRVELEQKHQAQQLATVNKRMDNLQNVVATSPTKDTWREECRTLIVKMAQSKGGGEAYREINNEIYDLVNKRAKVSLDRRLTNKRMRMATEGVSKSIRDKVSKIDVIAEDRKLVEIYTAIVKEMAIKCSIV